MLMIGVIVAPFGTRGQVKLRSYTDRPDHLRRIRTVYIGPKRQEHTLTKIIEHKPGLLVLSLRGVGQREDAEALRSSEVFIRETDAAPLDEGEYFIHTLYNLRVETEAGEQIGTVREVIETGANDVLVVSRPGQTDALIPMIHDVVQELDPASGKIVIRLLEGLL